MVTISSLSSFTAAPLFASKLAHQSIGVPSSAAPLLNQYPGDGRVNQRGEEAA